MYHLNFKIHGNPDRGQDDWTENHTISAVTVKALREKVLQFQGENDIGGGNWGEATLHHYGNLIGYMSYNLKVWDKPYWGGNEVRLLGFPE